MITTLQPEPRVSEHVQRAAARSARRERVRPGLSFTEATNPGSAVVAEPFDFAVGFSRQPLPKGNRFAIVTDAGGPGIMATDAAIRYGLELAILRPETLESLKAKLPPTANLFNPIDGGGSCRLVDQILTQRKAATKDCRAPRHPMSGFRGVAPSPDPHYTRRDTYTTGIAPYNNFSANLSHVLPEPSQAPGGVS